MLIADVSLLTGRSLQAAFSSPFTMGAFDPQEFFIVCIPIGGSALSFMCRTAGTLDYRS